MFVEVVDGRQTDHALACLPAASCRMALPEVAWPFRKVLRLLHAAPEPPRIGWRLRYGASKAKFVAKMGNATATSAQA